MKSAETTLTREGEELHDQSVVEWMMIGQEVYKNTYGGMLSTGATGDS